jgi:ribose/xylose/arabinose/galactoside ABC-type transport system permease subunit
MMVMNTSGFRNIFNLNFLVKNRVLVILVFICIISAIIQPIFFYPQNVLNVLRQISSSAVLGAGFTLILGSGAIDLSVGTQIGLMGVICAMASKVPGMPFTVVILVGIVLGTIFGLINAFFINTFSLPPFIVTLATMSIFKGICYITSNTTPVGNIAKYIINFSQGTIFGVSKMIIMMICVYVFMYLLINKTVFGRHAIAMGGNSEAARVSGINTKFTNYGVFVVMGICAFIASLMMTGRAASAQPVAGQGMEMDAIAAVVIGGTSMQGGTAYIGGTLLGCMIVGVINNILNLVNVDSNYQLVVKGLLILFAIILDAQSAKFLSKK